MQLSFLLLLTACGEPEPQGDPAIGREVLLYGDYVGAGVPKDVWFDLLPPIESNVLEREGESAGIPASFNLFTARNGVEVVGGVTCAGCHAAPLHGEVILGLGNHQSDYTTLDLSTFELAGLAVENRYGDDSPEYDAFYPLLRGAEAISPHIIAPVLGLNTAFSMERAAVAYRDPETGTWRDEPVFDIPALALASDVPPWWHLKKKSKLYYTGAGQGNHTRLVSQVSLVAVDDAEHYAEIEATMVDLLAYLRTIEPPAYPDLIDVVAAARGQAVFVDQCSECHGTYGDDWTYPERIIPLEDIGTDPAYALGFTTGGFTPWLQESFLAIGRDAADFDPEEGYIAPPLDGIWATAPYLHNGSIPDMAGILDSSARPRVFRRSFDSRTYDAEAMGWPYEVVTADDSDPTIYNTALPSLGNGGHTYGDVLSNAQRADLMEYLKTL